MGWTDRFWTASNWVLDTTIHVVADTLNTCGTLACTLGGVAFAVSNALAMQEVTASYYGAVRAKGTFDLGVEITNMGFGFNQSLPMDYSNQMNNGTMNNLTDYVRSEFVQTASTICVASGIVLRTLGANVKKWQEGREDRRYYANSSDRIQIAKPSVKEYLYVSSEAFFGSLTNAMISYSVATAALHFSGRIFPNITYPPHAHQHVSGAYYNGPVNIEPFALKTDLGESNFTVPLSNGINLDVLLKKAVDVAGNATYGGGFFFKMSKTPPPLPLAVVETISTTLGVSAYLANNFFGKKVKQLHDKRIREEDSSEEINEYTPINYI